MLLACIIHVLKKFLAGQVLTCANNPSDAPVFDFHDVFPAALAAKLEFDLCAPDFGMAVLHRGQAVGFVVACVFLVAHADEADFEQTPHRGQNFFAAKTLAREVAFDSFPNPGQRAGKIHQPIILGLIANLPPARMVEMLFTPSFIATSRL